MIKNIFKMPKRVKITGRTASITNAFVNGIIPCVEPSKKEITKALGILGLDSNDLRCAYCGDKATEWDHLRPLVIDQRPAGYISEIHNLVPACGKCNQSKGNKDWRKWIVSSAKLSPKTRGVKDLDSKIKRLEKFEKWKEIKPLDFKKIVGTRNWNLHWSNHQKILDLMKECQKHSDEMKKLIQKIYKK